MLRSQLALHDFVDRSQQRSSFTKLSRGRESGGELYFRGSNGGTVGLVLIGFIPGNREPPQGYRLDEIALLSEQQGFALVGHGQGDALRLLERPIQGDGLIIAVI